MVFAEDRQPKSFGNGLRRTLLVFSEYYFKGIDLDLEAMFLLMQAKTMIVFASFVPVSKEAHQVKH